MEKNNNALFFTCSVIEYIARKTYNKRADVVISLGDDIKRIYRYSDVFHCEPIEKVADDFVQRAEIKKGDYDNVSICKYSVPDYWDIGEVFARLIEDCYEEKDVFSGIQQVYKSWIADKILNFNSDMYYQSREYIAACYKEGRLITV